MAVDVGVGVIEPVIVAALGNGTDIVDLIDAVDADAMLGGGVMTSST